MNERISIAMELVAMLGAVAAFIYALGIVVTAFLVASIGLFITAQVIKAR